MIMEGSVAISFGLENSSCWSLALGSLDWIGGWCCFSATGQILVDCGIGGWGHFWFWVPRSWGVGLSSLGTNDSMRQGSGSLTAIDYRCGGMTTLAGGFLVINYQDAGRKDFKQ